MDTTPATFLGYDADGMAMYRLGGFDPAGMQIIAEHDGAVVCKFEPVAAEPKAQDAEPDLSVLDNFRLHAQN